MKITRKQLRRLIIESFIDNLGRTLPTKEFAENHPDSENYTPLSVAIGIIIQCVKHLHSQMPEKIAYNNKFGAPVSLDKTSPKLKDSFTLKSIVDGLYSSTSFSRNPQADETFLSMTTAGKDNLTSLESKQSMISMLKGFFNIALNESFYFTDSDNDLSKMGMPFTGFNTGNSSSGHVAALDLFFKTIFRQADIRNSEFADRKQGMANGYIVGFKPVGMKRYQSFVTLDKSKLKDLFFSKLHAAVSPMLGDVANEFPMLSSDDYINNFGDDDVTFEEFDEEFETMGFASEGNEGYFERRFLNFYETLKRLGTGAIIDKIESVDMPLMKTTTAQSIQKTMDDYKNWLTGSKTNISKEIINDFMKKYDDIKVITDKYYRY